MTTTTKNGYTRNERLPLIPSRRLGIPDRRYTEAETCVLQVAVLYWYLPVNVRGCLAHCVTGKRRRWMPGCRGRVEKLRKKTRLDFTRRRERYVRLQKTFTDKAKRFLTRCKLVSLPFQLESKGLASALVWRSSGITPKVSFYHIFGIALFKRILYALAIV